MKQGLHPVYHQVTVTCACGETFVTGSTQKTLKVEICSKCHPFFTGTQKLVDSARRVEKFKKKYGDVKMPVRKKSKKAASDVEAGHEHETQEAAASEA